MPLYYQFRLNIYDGKTLVIHNFVTPVYKFPNATDLANSILRVMNFNSRSDNSINYRVTVPIDLPSIPHPQAIGHPQNPEITAVITQVISVTPDEPEPAIPVSTI